MALIYVIHIVAGSLGLLSGYTALFAAKGAVVHRRSGMVFVYAMLTMCVAGTTIAALRNVAPQLNVPAAVMTSYLVITSLNTVKPITWWSKRWDLALLVVALTVAAFDLRLGVASLAKPGPPTFGFFLFGTVGALAATSDIRIVRSGALRGAARIARHLWRMSFALFIAAMSFFLGQAKVIPKPIRIMPLLMTPVLIVLVTMLYWLWRVRTKRGVRSLIPRVRSTAPARQVL
jgi:hypothetical protein